MNILQKVTWQAMKRNRTRTWVTIVGVVLSAAMFMAIASIAISSLDYLKRSCASQNGDYHCYFLHMDAEDLDSLSSHPEITELALKRTLGYWGIRYEESYDVSLTIAACNQAYFQNMPVKLTEGRLPENSGELLLDQDMLYVLSGAGCPTELGAEISIPVSDIAPDAEGGKEATVTSKSYTVVGYAQDPLAPVSGGAAAVLPGTLYTLDDGAQGQMLFCDAYVKTAPVSAALSLTDNWYGNIRGSHQEYLTYFGITDASLNDLTLILTAAAALCVIVLLGSVGLIYNSFSVSITERTKQFGLLSSIGATKKQLRQSVFFEASVISLIGIPIGLLLGFGGTGAAIWAFRRNIEQLLYAGDPLWRVSMNPVFSPWAVLIAAGIALTSVFLSAWIPARRATKISPLDAIRQAEDYKVGKKTAKVGKLTQKLWGIPGVLAKKYYAVSRKKYRAIVRSLSVSIAIFLATISVTGLLLDGLVAQSKFTNYDLSISVSDCGEYLEDIRKQDFVTRSVLSCQASQKRIIMSQEMYSQTAQENWDRLYPESTAAGMGLPLGLEYMGLQYLEDAALLALLERAGVTDTAPYFDASSPTALVVNLSGSAEYFDENGEVSNFIYQGLEVLSPDVQYLTLLPDSIPHALFPESTEQEKWEHYTFLRDAKGQTVVELVQMVPVLMPDGHWSQQEGRKLYYLLKQTTRDGVHGISYHRYEPETLTAAAEATAFQTEGIQTVSVGARLDETPFGLWERDRFVLVLVQALSTAENPEYANLCLKVNDYQAAVDYLEQRDIFYNDLLEEEMTSRRVIATVNAAVICFVLTIVLICSANIFNTISTNIALRRRDFGMLQSLGMQQGQMRRMLALEAFRMGLRALLWGLGIGLILQWLLFRVADSMMYIQYRFPWSIVATAILSVLALMTIATAYAFAKMKKDNPIEAIRQENL